LCEKPFQACKKGWPEKRSKLATLHYLINNYYPQYDSTGGVDSERTFVKQIVQKFCDDGSSDDLFNEEEMSEATEDDSY